MAEVSQQVLEYAPCPNRSRKALWRWMRRAVICVCVLVPSCHLWPVVWPAVQLRVAQHRCLTEVDNSGVPVFVCALDDAAGLELTRQYPAIRRSAPRYPDYPQSFAGRLNPSWTHLRQLAGLAEPAFSTSQPEATVFSGELTSPIGMRRLVVVDIRRSHRQSAMGQEFEFDAFEIDPAGLLSSLRVAYRMSNPGPLDGKLHRLLNSKPLVVVFPGHRSTSDRSVFECRVLADTDELTLVGQLQNDGSVPLRVEKGWKKKGP